MKAHIISKKIRLSRTNSKGEAPIYIRVTKNRLSQYKATKVRIEPRFWDEKKEVVKRKHPLSLEYNAFLHYTVTRLDRELISIF